MIINLLVDISSMRTVVYFVETFRFDNISSARIDMIRRSDSLIILLRALAFPNNLIGLVSHLPLHQARTLLRNARWRPQSPVMTIWSKLYHKRMLQIRNHAAYQCLLISSLPREERSRTYCRCTPEVCQVLELFRTLAVTSRTASKVSFIMQSTNASESGTKLEEESILWENRNGILALPYSEYNMVGCWSCKV